MPPFFKPGEFSEWAYQVAIAINQLVNAIHGGMADETICSRSWRERGRVPYRHYVVVLDAIFSLWQEPGHCKRAYENELAGKHRPQTKSPG
jgi:hypothetical protein